MMVSVFLARAFAMEPAPWAICASTSEADQSALQVQEEAKIRAAAVLAGEEAARKRRVEEAAASAAQSGTPACVPSLRGDTLTSARRALSKAHCRLGKVSRPRSTTTASWWS